jgi:cell division topological specificity factor
MTSFMDKFLKKPSSADTARQRLQLVLIHDRANLPPGQIELMKEELIRVISKYVDIDQSKAEIAMQNEGREQRLTMIIPISQGARKYKG